MERFQGIAGVGICEVHTFDTYAPTFEHVIWIFVGHFPLHSIRKRPMRLDGEFNFLEPSLKAFLDVWIRILAANGFNYGVAKCLMYSSVLIVDVLPISGTSSFGEGCHMYESLWKESRPLVTSMFHTLVNDYCVNAIGCVAIDRDGVAGDRAGIAGERAGIAGNRAGIAIDRAGIAGDRAGIAGGRAGIAGNRAP